MIGSNMILPTLFSIYLLLMPTMDCTSEVVCYKQTPSTIEGKVSWDVIDITSWERLETFWIDENTMQAKITQPNGDIEYTNYTK